MGCWLDSAYRCPSQHLPLLGVCDPSGRPVERKAQAQPSARQSSVLAGDETDHALVKQAVFFPFAGRPPSTTTNCTSSHSQAGHYGLFAGPDEGKMMELLPFRSKNPC